MRPPRRTPPRAPDDSAGDALPGSGWVRVRLRALGYEEQDIAGMSGEQVLMVLEAGVPPPVLSESTGDGNTRGAAVTSAVRVQAETQSRGQRERPAPLLLRVRDAAGLLAVSERVVWQLIRTGQLRPIHPAGLRATRIAPEDVEELARRWRAASQDGTVELT